MTVNIGLVTSDALVLGCDSVASTTGYYLDPMRCEFELDENGAATVDADGRFRIKFTFEDMRPVVTSAWGGVTKMFQIHPDPSPVVAVTAGLAKLQDRSIASLADEFYRTRVEAAATKSGKGRLINVEPICRAFLRFMRTKYQAHYKDSPLPEHLRQGPEFLIGGIGRDDSFPSLYRVSIQRNTVTCDFKGGATGVSWGGQSDAVERFIRGYDGSMRDQVESEVEAVLREHSEKTDTYIAELVNSILDKLKRKLPKGVQLKPPALGEVALDWDRFRVPIDYANLPLQEAVNFVSALVMSQASRARFAIGVATVGGRTHVGVITKAKGYRNLNEPELVHRFTGLSADA